ncbi:MAG TPA: NAD(+) synthase, partial [Candidatus Poseidoniaceae archaeon]
MSKIIGLLQVDSTVGDLAGNAKRLESLSAIAHAHGAKVAVATELAVCGYPPRDLLLQPDFITTSFETAKTLAVKIPILVGTPIPPDNERNLPANGVVRAGLLQAIPNKDNTNRIVARKQLLPSYDVFDETRYFTPANRSGICRSIGEVDLGITICEDAWQAAGLTPSSYRQDPVASLAELGRQGVMLDATVNLSASPYHADKVGSRIKVCRTAAKALQHPFLLANQVGGNDDLLFDGCSLVAWPDGKVVVAPAWQEGVLIVDLAKPENCRWVPFSDSDAFSIGNDEIKFLDSQSDGFENSTEIIEDITDAVIAGLADYCRKSGIKRIVLGLSGGIDSAVAACVACAAVGPENVLGIAMPSRFSSQHSIDDAKYTAEALGMEFKLEPIDDMHSSLEGTIGEVLVDGNPVASENIQSRLRGIIVMAHANAQNRMAIAT